MIQSFKSAELDRFSDLLTDHLNEVTSEMKVCTDAKVNKLLRGEVSNITSMKNAIGKHKLFTTSYQELTESSEDEPLPLPKRAPQERIKLAKVEKEPVTVAKYATKNYGHKIYSDALLSVK
jgi:hypothetical protein